MGISLSEPYISACEQMLIMLTGQVICVRCEGIFGGTEVRGYGGTRYVCRGVAARTEQSGDGLGAERRGATRH